ncbi:hypothetical protein DFJ73DRAFT_828479 [Zopfochytrium polystomum]|nr:hypothetical protein DFJ73DRAFT_828479 [Zopfochytrium polystomum]
MSKVVIVTGASRGIGLAVVRTLLRKGARVVGVSRTPIAAVPELQSLQAAHPSELTYVETDVTSAAAPAQVVARAQQVFGRLDGVVFNAGVLEPIARLADVEAAQFMRLMDVNVGSVVAFAKEALPALRRAGGKMIFVSSGAATSAYSGWGPYCASKAALNMLCEVYSKEERDVVSIALRPGVVDTEMQAIIREGKHASSMTADKHQSFVKLHEDGKLLPPEKPGHVIAELALRAPSELTGKFITWSDPLLADFQLA